MTTRVAKYNAAQPRVGPGVPTGGQWTAGAWAAGAWASAASAAGFAGGGASDDDARAVVSSPGSAVSESRDVRLTNRQYERVTAHFAAGRALVGDRLEVDPGSGAPRGLGTVNARGAGRIAFTHDGYDYKQDGPTLNLTAAPRSRVLLHDLDTRTYYNARTMKPVGPARDASGWDSGEVDTAGRLVVSYRRDGRTGSAVIEDVWADGAVKGALRVSTRQEGTGAFEQRVTSFHGHYSKAVRDELARRETPTMTAKRERAVVGYQDASSRVNDALRGYRTRGWEMDDGDAKAGRQHAATLLRTFRNHGSVLTMRAPLDLYRGLRHSFAQSVRSLPVGSMIHDGAFSSFTLSPRMSRDFAGLDVKNANRAVVLRIPRGSQVRALPATRSTEAEIILDPAIGFRITRRRRLRNGVVVIDVEPIDTRRKRT